MCEGKATTVIKLQLLHCIHALARLVNKATTLINAVHKKAKLNKMEQRKLGEINLYFLNTAF